MFLDKDDQGRRYALTCCVICIEFHKLSCVDPVGRSVPEYHCMQWLSAMGIVQKVKKAHILGAANLYYSSVQLHAIVTLRAPVGASKRAAKNFNKEYLIMNILTNILMNILMTNKTLPRKIAGLTSRHF